jgi:hypothetical protein
MSLPIELYYRILANLDIADLNDICGSSSLFEQICADPLFWKDKLEREYPDIYAEVIDNIDYIDDIDWRDVYLNSPKYKTYKTLYQPRGVVSDPAITILSLNRDYYLIPVMIYTNDHAIPIGEIFIDVGACVRKIARLCEKLSRGRLNGNYELLIIVGDKRELINVDISRKCFNHIDRIYILFY